MYKYIFTHGGVAHQDDFIAVCMALGMAPSATVYRGDHPTIDELNDRSVLILDVGLEYNDMFNNYDHHQDGCDECAATLFARHHLNIDEPWIDLVKLQDTKGPVVTAKQLGISVKDYYAIKGPIVKTVINMFGSKHTWKPTDPLHSIMVSIGKEIFDSVRFKVLRIQELKERPVVTNQSGKTWIDLTGLERPTAHLGDAGIVSDYKLINSQRELGRFNVLANVSHGTPPLDHPNLSWIHKDGFIGTIKKSADPIEFMNSL